MTAMPGPVTLIGSGETSLAGGRIFQDVVERLGEPPRIAILETPAGFELNSAQVAGRVADFLEKRLQNYKPTINVIAARKKGTEFSPDNEAVLEPLERANLIYMGAGSPTYAIRQLKESRAWELILRRWMEGGALCFASAAVIAVGSWALPVYEIYKVGQDVHSVRGLDLPGELGLKVSFIPHWNNPDGGMDVDTSRCFAGRERFEAWRRLTPGENNILGIDEHTGLTLDPGMGKCRVQGTGSVTLLQGMETRVYFDGEEFSIDLLGKINYSKERTIPNIAPLEKKLQPPVQVLELMEKRNSARKAQDWQTADRLRDKLRELGWEVQDLPDTANLSHMESRRN